MDGLWAFLDRFKDPVMALLALSSVCFMYLLITLTKCYNGLLKANVRAVALLQVLVFGKKATAMEQEE